MEHINIEIKARIAEPNTIRNILIAKGARFVGTDMQCDTYFQVAHGRLKLREGNIENHLIHYSRSNQEGPKTSEVTLFKTDPDSSLKHILNKALGVLVVVEKQREIYFIDNVKFHIDLINNTFWFAEIEAIDMQNTRDIDALHAQCNFYIELFGIKNNDLQAKSYSDMLLQGELV